VFSNDDLSLVISELNSCSPMTQNTTSTELQSNMFRYIQ